METQTFLDHADSLGCVQSPGGSSGEPLGPDGAPPRLCCHTSSYWNLTSPDTAESSLCREGDVPRGTCLSPGLEPMVVGR